MHTNKRLIDVILQAQASLWSMACVHKLSKIAGALAIIIAMAAAVIYSAVKPDNNWDMIPYIATALENRYPDANALHTETWRQVAEVASEGELQVLKHDGGFRSAQWENPDSFKSLLVMYRVKAG